MYDDDLSEDAPQLPARLSAARFKTGVIDIGSNSVRLVAYEGPRRVPTPIFNEKVLAGLGSELAETGNIGAESMARAVDALARFSELAKQMELASLRCIATAAVRDAGNGAELVAHATRMGLNVEVLSGEEEASYSAMGVMSAFPGAKGMVADLGGGSLELAEIDVDEDGLGTIGEARSLPLGVLRIDPDAKPKAIAAQVADAFGDALPAKGRDLYLVGGSWRALARIDMAKREDHLPIAHYHLFTPKDAVAHAQFVYESETGKLPGKEKVSSARLGTLKAASRLLEAMVLALEPSSIIISAWGLREGLLYDALHDEERVKDPLLVATGDLGAHASRFPEHGQLIESWIAPLFADEDEDERRLRAAACNLSDTAWRTNPDFRAETAREIALHGTWVAIDGAGRECVAQAVHASYGGGFSRFPRAPKLAGDDAIKQASCWGAAIRLAQRLSGGTAGVLQNSALGTDGTTLILSLPDEDDCLGGESVEKRLRQLAQIMDMDYRIDIGEAA